MLLHLTIYHTPTQQYTGARSSSDESRTWLARLPVLIIHLFLLAQKFPRGPLPRPRAEKRRWRSTIASITPLVAIVFITLLDVRLDHIVLVDWQLKSRSCQVVLLTAALYQRLAPERRRWKVDIRSASCEVRVSLTYVLLSFESARVCLDSVKTPSPYPRQVVLLTAALFQRLAPERRR